MEAFWFFNMNGVGVAAASNETYTMDGTVVKPVKKMKEVKPGILCSVIGPQEGIDKYMRFITGRFANNAGLTAVEAIEDVQWLVSGRNIDVNEFMSSLNETIKTMKKIVKNPEAYDLEEEAKKLERNEVFKKFKDPMTPEDMKERWKLNLMLSAIRIIEALPGEFITHAVTVDPSNNQAATLDWHEKHSGTPLFNQWGLQEWKPSVVGFGQVILDLRKEYATRKHSFKDEKETAVHLRNMITELDTKHNPDPVPLEFMVCYPSDAWRWKAF